MRSKSYEIDPVLMEIPGCDTPTQLWHLFLFEDDDCIFDETYATQNEAKAVGESYLNGDDEPEYPQDEIDAEEQYEASKYDDMDGDHDSAMESAGWGTDEDYGYYGEE